MIDYCVATQEDKSAEQSRRICIEYVLQMKERKEMKSKKNQNMSLGGKSCGV